MTPNNFRVKNGLTVSNGVNVTAGNVVISTGQLVIGATAINATSMSVSAQTAYTNAVSYTDTKIGTANTAMAANAATAYSNAVSYTDTKIGTANTAMAANAATAYTNAIAIAANATNITSGTVAFARLPALYLGTTTIQSTSAAQAVSGITTLAAGNTTITGFANVSTTLQVGTNTATFGTAAYIVSNGNVGIGTSSPGAKLDVRGNLAVGGADAGPNFIAFRGTTNDGPGTYEHTFIGERIHTPTESSELFLFKGNDPSSSGPDRVRVGASEFRVDTYATALNGPFETVANSANLTTHFIVTNGGNVGIGNTAPGSKLVVAGAVALGNTTVSGTAALGNTTVTGFANVTSTIQGGSSLAIAGALSGVTTAAMGNTTITGFANVTSTIQGGSGLTIAGALSGVTTAAMGNTTITGFANVTSTLQVGGISTFSANVVLGSVGVSANGGFGTAGHVLHSNGTATYWAADDNTTYDLVAVANTAVNAGLLRLTDSSSSNDTVTFTGAGTSNVSSNATHIIINSADQYLGTVTSIVAANGLNGGTITSTGTMSVLGGSTLTVNSTGAHVNSALSIASLALSGDLTVSGNLTVSGTRTYVNTTTLDVGDNIFTLNADLGAVAPSQDAGIEIMRGTSANVQFLWDETNDRWSTNGQPLAVSSLVAAGALSGVTTAALGNTTITGFASVTSTIQGGSSLTIAGALSGVTTAAMGNTTITGFVNASASVNSALLTVGTSFVANTTVTTITDTTGLSGSTQSLAVKNGSYVLGIVPRTGSGAYNNLTTLEDTSIVVTGTSIGNANLAIVPWSGASGGLRMVTVANSTTFSIVGNTTITGFANVTSTLQVGGISTFSGNVVLGSVGLSSNGGFGTAGQVLHSNGTATYWAADDQGVTSVATANGLTGGTITSTGTLGVSSGSTLTVNTTGIHVNSALSITSLAAASNVQVGTVGAGNGAFVSNSLIFVGNNTVYSNITPAGIFTGTNTATFGTAAYHVANGNLGLGTSTSLRPLHAYYNSAVVGAYSAILQGATGGYGAGVSFQSLLTGGALAEMARITADGEAAWDTTAANQDAGLRFYTALNGTVAEKMRINSDGVVLVNRTSASGYGKLNVDGGADFTAGNVLLGRDSGNVLIGTTTSYTKLTVSNGGSTRSGITISDTNTSSLMLFAGNSSPSVIATDSYDLVFRRGATVGTDNGTETMRILNNSGNTGIGNTAPAHKLSVNGPGYFGDTLWFGSGGYLSWTTGYSDGTTQTFQSPTSGSIALIANGTAGLFIKSNQNVGIGTTTPGYKLEVNGSFAATTKSFVIPHPTKPGMKLRYGSLEGPENGVYVRGRLRAGEKIIQLPDYWEGLVDQDTYTVNLTPVGKHQELYVDHIASDYIIVGGGDIDCFYTVFAERNDVEKLEVEF